MGLTHSISNRTIYKGLLSKELQPLNVDSVKCDLIPSNIYLAQAELKLASELRREYRLADALSKVSGHYDAVLVDCPPSLGLLSINCLVAADYLLIPIQTEYKSVEATINLLQTTYEIAQEVNPNLRVLGAIPTMYDERTSQSKRALQTIQEVFQSLQSNTNFKGSIVFDPVPRRTDFANATAAHLPLAKYSPKHPALAPIKSIAEVDWRNTMSSKSSKSNKKESFSLAGKGILGGLVSNDSALSKDVEKAAEWVDIDKIIKSPLQPRQFFDQSSLDSLSDAFKKHGFRGALNVRPVGNGTYELVAGERRWRAAQQASLEKVRCIVDEYTDEQALEFALMENLQRENLSKLEETEGILKFIEVKLGIDRDRAVNIVRTEGHSDKSARSYVAPSDEITQIEELLSLFDIGLQTFRTKHLRTLSLPDDLKQAHLNQGLSYSSAIELSKVKDDQERCDLLGDVLQKGLSFRATKERVREALSQDAKLGSLESPDIVKRFAVIARRVKQSPAVLKKSQSRKRIERLLKELESLISEE